MATPSPLPGLELGPRQEGFRDLLPPRPCGRDPNKIGNAHPLLHWGQVSRPTVAVLLSLLTNNRPSETYAGDSRDPKTKLITARPSDRKGARGEGRD